MLKKLIQRLKPTIFSVIIFDGKTMQYKKLTQKQIDKIKKDPECQDWIITVQEGDEPC